MKFEVFMKPIGLCKRTKAFRPKYDVTVEAEDKNAAALLARNSAAGEGFHNYAVTKIKQVLQ